MKTFVFLHSLTIHQRCIVFVRLLREPLSGQELSEERRAYGDRRHWRRKCWRHAGATLGAGGACGDFRGTRSERGESAHPPGLCQRECERRPCGGGGGCERGRRLDRALGG